MTNQLRADRLRPFRSAELPRDNVGEAYVLKPSASSQQAQSPLLVWRCRL